MPIKINIIPVPKPRMTRADVWKKRKCVIRYREFCDQLRESFKPLPPETPIKITFVMPMPKSWSLKKCEAMKGTPHFQRPDKDNLEKAFNDALFPEDSNVWCSMTKKIWGWNGEIIVDYNDAKW